MIAMEKSIDSLSDREIGESQVGAIPVFALGITILLVGSTLQGFFAKSAFAGMTGCLDHKV